ncbi:MAG: LLM class flavin-dependent oxidoreductase [Gammaproteobacteria bacterium]|nr:LLM class flavin-dependent oxidoreductase [Gammaproteobacteria bacterium]
MKFDLFSLMQKRDETWTAGDVFDDMVDTVRLGEQIGMETAWFAEHHFNNYSLCPSPLMAAAYCAGQTSRIRLGTAVVVLPLYQPLRLLQEIGMVDVMSNGRLVVGIGSGYQDYEFQRFGVKLAENVDHTLEILDILELGLTQDEFAYTGRYYKYPATQIAIKPIQQPMPEIWVAGLMSHPKVQKRVAQSGYVPMLTPSWNPMSSLIAVRDSYRDINRSIGRDSASLPLGLMRFIHVTNSREEAIDAAERARYSSRASLSLRLDYAKFNGIYVEDSPAKNEPPIEEMVENYIIGDVEHCIEKIVKDHDVMLHSHMLCNVQLGGVPHRRVMRTMEALGNDIIPGVQKELAKRGVTDPVIDQQPLVSRSSAA